MKALISGITGQDGAYLAELLLSKGYAVYGIKRRTSTPNLWRLDALGLRDRITLINGDMTDMSSLQYALDMCEPDEVYNLAAQSFVHASFDTPTTTFDVNAKGVINLLEAIRLTGWDIKFYQASTSEMFGGMQPESQNENTPFNPRSPYAVAKVAAHYATINYREAYGLSTSCGILFNHESPLRGEEFVTQKIALAVKKIRAGKQDKLYLGNLNAKRDWGHAKDYVKAMMLINQRGGEYVVATGKTYSVREFVEKAFSVYGMDYEDHVEVANKFLRPLDVPVLCGDPTKIKEELLWEPTYTLDGMIEEMVRD